MKQSVSTLYNYILLPILLLVICSTNIQAQTTYPVQTNVYLAPPFSNFLSDYYSTSKEKLVVTLLNRDQLRPTLEVRLRVSVTAVNGMKIQSREEINYPTITLDAGIPMRLTQDDLAPYFLPRNTNTQGSLNQGKLPEGMIEFTFQVIEKHTGKVLSAPASGRAWLSSQKPPILRLPSNNEFVAFKDPFNLKFQWEPLHKNLSQIEYEFELKELPNNGAAPQSAFLYAMPIYQERLVYTYLMYNVMMPPLNPDKTYAWRIRAIAKDGVDDLNMFDNGGYSEIFSFRTTGNCQPPFNCMAELKDRSLMLNWTPNEGNNEYVVQYRLKNDTKAEWKEGKTYETQQTLYDMQRGATYEYRVGSICTSGQPVFTPTAEITIPAVDSVRLARCGIQGTFNLENKELIENLKVGDVIMVNDYPVKLTQVSGGGGSFSGEGWVPVNWLLNTKWQVEFDNITVNTDKQLIGGSIRAKYDESESQIAKLDEITEGGHENTRKGIIIPDYKLDVVIPPNPTFDYNPETGEMTIFTTDGQQVAVINVKNDGKEAFPLTIKDKDGNIYRVDVERDADGKPVEVKEGEKPKLTSSYLGKQGEPLSKGSFNPNELTDKTAIVTFEKGSAKYALDVWDNHFQKSVKIRKEYDKLSDKGDGYYAAWKFLPVGGSDKVVAKVKVEDKNPAKIVADSIIFTTQQGTRFEAKRIAENSYELTLAAGQAKDVQEIYALYPVEGSKSKFLTLGKLNVVSYEKQTNKLVVVQVKGNTIDENSLKTELGNIYNPVGVNFEVSIDNYDYAGDIGGLFDKNSKLLSAYNDKMKALQQQYAKDKGGLEKETCYVFVLGDSGDGKNRDSQGFMPRGQQFAYIFKENIKTDINQIIAHELGHGRWRLKHIFDSTYGFSDKDKNKTDNLMDYTGGANLAKWQWEQVYDPAWSTNPFDGDEKGMIVKSNIELLTEFQKNSQYTFFTPDRKCITIPGKDLKNVYFSTATYLHLVKSDNITDKQIKDYYPLGAFCAFELNSGEYYAALKNSDGQIKGYYQIKDNIVTDKKSNYPITDCSQAICLFLTKNELEENIFGAGVFSIGSSQNCIANFDVEDVTLPIDFGFLKYHAENNFVKPIANLAYTLRNNEETKPTGTDKREPFDEVKYDNFLNELSKQLSSQYKQGSGIIRDFEFKNEGYEYAIADISDRLVVFDREVKDTKFIVHFATAPCDIPKDSLENISQRVVERSQLRDKKLVYLLAPGWDKIYWETGDYFPSTATSVELCVYSTIPETRTPVGQQNSNNIITDIVNIYRQVPKPYYLLKHFITGSESGVYTTYTDIEKLGTITGKDHIHDFALIVDSRIWGLDALESKASWELVVAALSEMGAQGTFTSNPTMDDEYYSRRKAMQQEINNYYSIHPLSNKRVPHGLRESYLMGTGGTLGAAPFLYTEWYLSSLNDFLFVRMYKNELEDEYFISSRNEAMGEDILTSLDALGLASSPWGADIVTDVIGVGVAGYYKKPGQAAIYTSSAILPFVSAGAVKFSLKATDEIKGLARGTHIVEEAADGTYVIVKKGGKVADEIVDVAKKMNDVVDALKKSFPAPPYVYNKISDDVYEITSKNGDKWATVYAAGLYFIGRLGKGVHDDIKANKGVYVFEKEIILAEDLIIKGKFVSNIKKIDLMGGKTSQLGDDFVNIDIVAEQGIKGDVTKLSQFIKPNSVDEIIVSNPFPNAQYAGPKEFFLSESSEVMKSGSKMTINGTISNKFFKNITAANIEELGFEIIEFQVPLKSNFQNMKFYQVDGVTQIPNDRILTTIIRKK